MNTIIYKLLNKIYDLCSQNLLPNNIYYSYMHSTSVHFNTLPVNLQAVFSVNISSISQNFWDNFVVTEQMPTYPVAHNIKKNFRDSG
jgi:hypothetical protein